VLAGLLICLSLGGCNSIVKPHQRRIERLLSSHEEIVDVSKRLNSIERVMLYVGRIRDSPLADDALDVAIAIHGQPDDTEKTYAQNITSQQIEREKSRAFSLIARRRQLKTTIDMEKIKLSDDITQLSNLEGKYSFASKLISRYTFGIGALLLIFLVLKLVL
jgi:hypothetical protein